MSQLEQLFAPRCPSGWRVAKIGIVSVLTRAMGSWIVRIGAQQWEGLATSEHQAMQRAWQFVGDQLRPVSAQYGLLKKSGEI